MLWFFTKGQARLRVLTSLDAVSGEYLVEVAWPDRETEIHRFTDEDACSVYLSRLEEDLDGEHWIADGVRLAERKAIVN